MLFMLKESSSIGTMVHNIVFMLNLNKGVTQIRICTTNYNIYLYILCVVRVITS